jgi:hypothetical protein
MFKIQINDKQINKTQRLFAHTSKTAAPGIMEESVHGTQESVHGTRGGGNVLANAEKR